MSDDIFDMMRVYLERGEGKALVPKVDSIFNIQIKKTKEGPVVKTFVIDLKNGQGKAYVGSEKNANSSFTMIDSDF